MTDALSLSMYVKLPILYIGYLCRVAYTIDIYHFKADLESTIKSVEI